MTPAEMRVLKSLVAVMWADGKVEGAESSVLEGLLAGFGASDEEEKEVLSWAKTSRTLDDVPLSELTAEDRELLLANAALLTLADGEQSASEKEVLQKLVKLLGFSDSKAQEIIDSSRDGAIQLGTKPLDELPKPPPFKKKLSKRPCPSLTSRAFVSLTTTTARGRRWCA
jgi:tellurite resistance protein